jgi:hypothetical protein
MANQERWFVWIKKMFSAFLISRDTDLSRAELTFLWLISGVLFVLTIFRYRNYADAIGDSRIFMDIASAILRWDFHGMEIKQFWGLSYFMAALSSLFRMSEMASLLLIGGVCSLFSVLLAQRLWGGWIAGFFAILNLQWLQRSFLGGAETLFVILLFASFGALRRERWLWASGLAALATVVRPVGMLLLVAIGISLLMKREYKRLLLCTGLALIIGMLYVLPFWIYFHDPLGQVHSYQHEDWQSGSAIGFPFLAIVKSFIADKQPWTNVSLIAGWIAFVLMGTVAMARKGFRPYFREHRTECLFAFLYIAFLFTYNSARWARVEFVRFAIPALPFVLISLRGWIPKSRALLYGLGALCSVLAACSAIGIRNIFSILR